MRAVRKPSTRTTYSAGSTSAGLFPERELRGIIERVLRLAKSTEADETEVHVDEADESLTRFANNAIHQNVAEHGLTVSVSKVVDGRKARDTNNRVDEKSLRGGIDAWLRWRIVSRRILVYCLFQGCSGIAKLSVSRDPPPRSRLRIVLARCGALVTLR